MSGVQHSNNKIRVINMLLKLLKVGRCLIKSARVQCLHP